jgi:hypothetical protein
MTEQEMLKQDLERAVKELEIDGSNTKQKVKYLLEECLEVYFKPKKYLTFNDLMNLETLKVENGIRSSIRYKVLLNGSEYEMGFNKGILSREFYLIKDDNIAFKKYLYKEDEQFFNDLHLELVEE